MEKIEYRVRPVTRFIVTRFHGNDESLSGGVETHGEFDNSDTAYKVAYALCQAEHGRLGWPPEDARLQYPTEAQSLGSAQIGGLKSKPDAFPLRA